MTMTVIVLCDMWLVWLVCDSGNYDITLNSNPQNKENKMKMKMRKWNKVLYSQLWYLDSGQSWIIFTLSLDMVTPEEERMYSKYSTNLE